ncbi:MAG: outer membrane protein assembly factor BamB [Gammaproteobacteria bacterium]|nr:outer membrane protein assembly factor BamB [Gammaproteobacteria bacterium]
MQLTKALTVRIFVFLLFLFNTGCTSFFIGKENLSEAVDLPADPQILSFNTVWKKDIGNGYGDKVLSLRPAVVGDRIFVTSTNGVLKAMSVTKGNEIWSRKIGHTIASGVSADQNIVVVGSEDGLLMAFSAVDGRAGWTHQMSTEVLAAPTVISGLVIARAIDGQVTALDARSGAVVWKQYIGVADLTIRGNSSALFLDGMILFTNGKGRLTVLSVKDGSPVYSIPLVSGKGATAVSQISDILATPAIRNGVLYVSAYRQKTLAINLRDGKLLWESPLATSNDLFADNNFVYIADKNSLIHALDIKTGKLVWSKTDLEGRHISPLTGNGAWISTVDTDGMLSLIDVRSGSYVGNTKVGGDRSYIAPIITPVGLITYTADGDLALTNFEAR